MALGENREKMGVKVGMEIQVWIRETTEKTCRCWRDVNAYLNHLVAPGRHKTTLDKPLTFIWRHSGDSCASLGHFLSFINSVWASIYEWCMNKWRTDTRHQQQQQQEQHPHPHPPAGGEIREFPHQRIRKHWCVSMNQLVWRTIL